MSERTVTIKRGIYTITATLRKSDSRVDAKESCYELHSVGLLGVAEINLDDMTEEQLIAFDNTCCELEIDLFGEVDAWISEQADNPDENYIEAVRGYEEYSEYGVSPRDFA